MNRPRVLLVLVCIVAVLSACAEGTAVRDPSPSPLPPTATAAPRPRPTSTAIATSTAIPTAVPLEEIQRRIGELADPTARQAAMARLAAILGAEPENPLLRDAAVALAAAYREDAAALVREEAGDGVATTDAARLLTDAAALIVSPELRKGIEGDLVALAVQQAAYAAAAQLRDLRTGGADLATRLELLGSARPLIEAAVGAEDTPMAAPRRAALALEVLLVEAAEVEAGGNLGGARERCVEARALVEEGSEPYQAADACVARIATLIAAQSPPSARFVVVERTTYDGQPDSGQRLAVIDVKVIDRRGSPISGAVVEINNGPHRTSVEAQVDSDGYKGFDNVGASVWTVQLLWTPIHGSIANARTTVQTTGAPGERAKVVFQLR